MKKNSLSLGILYVPFLLLFLFLPSLPSPAADIDPQERTFLFDLSSPEKGGDARLIFSEQNNTAELSFDIPREADLKNSMYALHIRGIDTNASPLIILNDRSVDFDPVRRKDGFLYRFHSRRLKPQNNVIRIEAEDSKSISFDSIQAFSLKDTFEEDHFEAAFSDVKIATQPAKHPDQDKYDALHYDLTLELNMASTLISNAILAITAQVTAASLDQLVLDFHPNGGNMVVSQVQDDLGNPLSFTINASSNWLLVTLPETFSTSDTFTVKVFYSGTPAATGDTVPFGAPYRRGTHNSGTAPVIYTFSQPYGARHWWPCKDVPEDKATVDLHITTAKPYYVVSNGNLLSIQDLGETKRCFHYSETYPIVTYLVSVCCANYVYVSGVYTSEDGLTTMPIGHYVYPENYEEEKNGLIGTLEAMRLFVDLVGEYPFIKEKYVTATHNSGSGMEHQTCTSMPADNLYPDGRHRRNVHELFHQWFGDSITMRHYDHLWLNEGFATYSEALYVERYQGKAAFHDYVNAWPTSDDYPIVSSNADLFSNAIVYKKGAWVLHMLRHIMGDEDFFTAIRNYYKKYAYSTALTPNLQAEFEAVYGESLTVFFNQWVYTAGRPNYAWSWHVEENKADSILHLTIDQTQAGAAFEMPIDVRISDINGNSWTYVVENTLKSQTFDISIGDKEAFNLELDPDNWILNNFSASSVSVPTWFSITPNGTNDGAILIWTKSAGSVSGYQVILSENLTSWTLALDSGILTADKGNYVLEGLDPNSQYYLRIRALSTTGQPSELSHVYGISMKPLQKKVLIVEGYDRWSSQAGRGASHPWAAWHGMAVNAFGIGFDACANEAVLDGSVLLASYDAVIWVLGEESTTDHSFDSQEQTLVTTYLQGGGKLFVSGAEIGWDLDHRDNGEPFYRNYLKAVYEDDDSNGIYALQGDPAGIFHDLSFSFDDGSAGIYYAQYPDEISPNGGSAVNLRYGGTLGAGLQFSGIFPGGTAEGKLVYLGFPFETIYPEEMRFSVMDRILRFFDIEPHEPLPNMGWMLY
ncbi:fibronectin type III domain-containing protein [Candidatus Sumerlaeota bacterium]|nr:fibronectin type III domain-containing protein [Candidatus Sumerlaeota bacterium]